MNPTNTTTAGAANAGTTTRIITDLAELRTAIRQADQVAVFLYDDKGGYMAIIALTKKEALYRAIEQDKFDDYAAQLDGGRYLFLNYSRREGLRDERRPARLAARHAELLARKASYERTGLAVPAHMLRELAETAPARLRPLEMIAIDDVAPDMLQLGDSSEIQTVDLGGGVLVKDSISHLREIGAIDD